MLLDLEVSIGQIGKNHTDWAAVVRIYNSCERVDAVLVRETGTRSDTTI